MTKPIDPRALRTFGAVCRAGSISAAARQLNISQPSVSTTIARLEERLEVVLFRRGRSGIVLTAEGMVLQRRAEAMEALLQGAAQEVDAATAGVAGPLRVGGTPGALVSLLPRAIDRLERERGTFALNVIERADRDLIDMLRKGEIELAFVTTEIEAPPEGIDETTLIARPVCLDRRAQE